MLIFEIARLVNKAEGAAESLSIDEAVSFDEADHLKPLSNFTAESTFIRLPHEISVHLADCKIDMECECSKCLAKYTEHVLVSSAEREFLIDLPKSQMDVTGEEFFVGQKYWTVSLLEMVRQEIILHLPAVPVCSSRCRGLCQHCGANLNKASCNCKN